MYASMQNSEVTKSIWRVDNLGMKNIIAGSQLWAVSPHLLLLINLAPGVGHELLRTSELPWPCGVPRPINLRSQ